MSAILNAAKAEVVASLSLSELEGPELEVRVSDGGRTLVSFPQNPFLSLECLSEKKNDWKKRHCRRNLSNFELNSMVDFDGSEICRLYNSDDNTFCTLSTFFDQSSIKMSAEEWPMNHSRLCGVDKDTVRLT